MPQLPSRDTTTQPTTTILPVSTREVADLLAQAHAQTQAQERTPSSSTPPIQRRRRRAGGIRSHEVSGQCSVCKDFFSVSLFRVDGEWRVHETNRLSYRTYRREDGTYTRVLTHRPDYCKGVVTLYGSLEEKPNGIRKKNQTE